MNSKIFEKVCRMSQKELKKYVARQLERTHNGILIGDGYVYAQGSIPVLLVAHMDTVHKETPKTFVYDKKQGSLSSPQGIGGDDRCGVYMIFEIVKKFHCSVLFCEDEEIGGVGAEKFLKSSIAEDLTFNYIIEFDRKGNKDAVFYDCDNPEFEEFITKEFYETAWGTFSDISYLAPALGCAAVNLSCGYYNAHTTKEYVVLNEMQDSIDAACKILERTTEEDKFEYIESAYKYNYGVGNYYSKGYGWYDDYNDTYSYEKRDAYYFIEFIDEKGETDWYETYGYTRAEAIGNFCIRHPELSYSSIVDIVCDEEWV